MAQMKEHSKTSELSDEEIANLSDGEFKVLVIKMLTELTEFGRKMKEQMKDTQNEIKQNIAFFLRCLGGGRQLQDEAGHLFPSHWLSETH